LPEFVEADRIDPRVAGNQAWLAVTYYALNRRSEAQAVAQRSVAQNPDDADMRTLLLDMAYTAGDDRAAESQMQWFSGRPEEYMSLDEQALEAITLGQRLKAQELLRKEGDLERRRNLTVIGEISEQDEALFGDCKAARKSAFPGAIALAVCFDTAQVAKSLATMEDAAKREPNSAERAPAAAHARGVGTEARPADAGNRTAQFDRFLRTHLSARGLYSRIGVFEGWQRRGCGS